MHGEREARTRARGVGVGCTYVRFVGVPQSESAWNAVMAAGACGHWRRWRSG